MEHNVQNVTLSLTLPISCHICLGKVRQPVICVNHHVFCSSCIDLWLKNNNQCPACRVPITRDNPCKDIIGGTSENERVLSHSVRKHLRKTRLDLLQKEYEIQTALLRAAIMLLRPTMKLKLTLLVWMVFLSIQEDEIEYLVKETEELKRTNLILEERLNEVADPIAESSPCSCGNRQEEDKSSVCNKLLKDWNRKLEEVNAANKRVTEDIDKFKEENRRLKNENVEIVRENLRLKNEVELRSPQKFGRFTVAALQAKVDQYEREMSRLKKALERSDQYIEELEAQIVQLKRPPEDKQMEKSQCGNTAFMEEHTVRAATSHVCQDISTAKSFPKYSKDDGIYSDHSKGLCPISVRLKQTQSKTVGSSKLKNGLHTTVLNDEEQTSLDRDSPSKIMVSMSQDLSSPSSSIPFSALKLNTPNCKTSSLSNTNLKKPLTYLRKLVFDDLPRRRELGRLASAGGEYNVNIADGATQPGQTNAVFSHFCHIKEDSQEKNSEKEDNSLQFRKQGRNAADQFLSRLHSKSGEDLNQAGTSCENTGDVNLNYDSVDPNNAVSRLESQENLPHTSVPCLTPDWVKQFQSDSPVHMCESSEKTTLSHHESSLFNSLSSSLADNEEQADLFMAQQSTDGYNIDFNNHLHSNNLPCQEEVRPHAYSDKVFLPGYICEPAGLSSSLPQIYCGSPPAKRKLLKRSNNSPSKSSKH